MRFPMSLHRRWFLSLAAFGCVLATASAATTAELNQVADAYLAAYTAQDFDRLAPFYTEASVFDDPTAAGIWGEAFTVKGGANIVHAMRTGWTLVKSITFNVRERITFHDRVVSVGTSVITMDGAMFGGERGRLYTFAFPAVTILQIDDGKVLLHLDHYDYSALRQG